MTNQSVNTLPYPAETRDKTRSWRLTFVAKFERFAKKLSMTPRPIRLLVYPIARLIFEGTAIGLLRPREVDRFVEVGYVNRWTVYDPRRYQLPHDEYMLPTLKRLANGTSLLDAFCGQGREAEILANAGFQVTGVDRLQKMIEHAWMYAAERGFPATFLEADFESMDTSRKYDVVYTSCWMYSTFQGECRRLKFLTQCRDLCAVGGIVVISFDNRTGSPFVRTARHLLAKTTAFLTAGNRASQPGERIATSGLFWHCHPEKRVVDEVETSGLRIIETLVGHNGAPTFVFATPQETAQITGTGATIR